MKGFLKSFKSELMKKVNPAVVAAARAQADQEIIQLRLAQLQGNKVTGE